MPQRAKRAQPAAARFAGFDRGAPHYLAELAAEMNRDWFEANKPRYAALWVEPMTALLAEIHARLAKPYAPLKLGKPKLFRQHRDVRFSKDKSPYKTHVSGLVSLRENCVAIYMHFGIDSEFVGAGTYFFEPKQLPRWRKLVAADKTAKPLISLISKLRAAGYEVGGHDDYKRVPQPYKADHPRADLLKLRGLTVGFPPIPRGLFHRRELVDWMVEAATASVPLVSWLARNMK
jgi:uncharacterized protein (TIGR02453 family)